MAPLTKVHHEPASDGRARRSQRRGHAIVEALLALVGEGIVAPTAQQVAARAGVGLRTVFRRFSDMESLFAQMDARLQAEALPLLIGGRPSGSMRERAQTLVRQRCAFFERIGPFKRSGNLKRPHSAFLSNRHAMLVRELRRDLLRWLPEMKDKPAELVDALDLATSFEAWDRLRTEQRLTSQRVLATMQTMVGALLAGTR